MNKDLGRCASCHNMPANYIINGTGVCVNCKGSYNRARNNSYSKDDEIISLLSQILEEVRR